MVQLEKADWERAKQVAEQEIKGALINLEVNKNLLKTAEEMLKTFEEKIPTGIG